jgi:hypothetical protein
MFHPTSGRDDYSVSAPESSDEPALPPQNLSRNALCQLTTELCKKNLEQSKNQVSSPPSSDQKNISPFKEREKVEKKPKTRRDSESDSEDRFKKGEKVDKKTLKSRRDSDSEDKKGEKVEKKNCEEKTIRQ